jgi:putative Holliday junction resolvase
LRVVALDYGSARCGVAVSDPTGTLVTPRDPVLSPATKKGFQRLKAVIRELGAERVLVGLPIALGGHDTPQTVEVREFAARLARAIDVPVTLYDERFTTSLALQAGGTGSLDSRAAATLLDEWLSLPIRQETPPS